MAGAATGGDTWQMSVLWGELPSQSWFLSTKFPWEELSQASISPDHEYHIILRQDPWVGPLGCAFKSEKRLRLEGAKDTPDHVLGSAQGLLLTPFPSVLFRILMKYFAHIMEKA